VDTFVVVVKILVRGGEEICSSAFILDFLLS